MSINTFTPFFFPPCEISSFMTDFVYPFRFRDKWKEIKAKFVRKETFGRSLVTLRVD